MFRSWQQSTYILCPTNLPNPQTTQGKTIRRLVEGFHFQETLADAAIQRYTLSIADLPPSEDEQACAAYEAPLCRDFSNAKGNRGNSNSTSSQHNSAGISHFSSHHAPGPASTLGLSAEMDDGAVLDDVAQEDAMSVPEDFDLVSSWMDFMLNLR